MTSIKKRGKFFQKALACLLAAIMVVGILPAVPAMANNQVAPVETSQVMPASAEVVDIDVYVAFNSPHGHHWLEFDYDITAPSDAILRFTISCPMGSTREIRWAEISDWRPGVIVELNDTGNDGQFYVRVQDLRDAFDDHYIQQLTLRVWCDVSTGGRTMEGQFALNVTPADVVGIPEGQFIVVPTQNTIGQNQELIDATIIFNGPAGTYAVHASNGGGGPIGFLHASGSAIEYVTFTGSSNSDYVYGSLQLRWNPIFHLNVGAGLIETQIFFEMGTSSWHFQDFGDYTMPIRFNFYDGLLVEVRSGRTGELIPNASLHVSTSRSGYVGTFSAAQGTPPNSGQFIVPSDAIWGALDVGNRDGLEFVADAPNYRTGMSSINYIWLPYTGVVVVTLQPANPQFIVPADLFFTPGRMNQIHGVQLNADIPDDVNSLQVALFTPNGSTLVSGGFSATLQRLDAYAPWVLELTAPSNVSPQLTQAVSVRVQIASNPQVMLEAEGPTWLRPLPLNQFARIDIVSPYSRIDFGTFQRGRTFGQHEARYVRISNNGDTAINLRHPGNPAQTGWIVEHITGTGGVGHWSHTSPNMTIGTGAGDRERTLRIRPSEHMQVGLHTQLNLVYDTLWADSGRNLLQIPVRADAVNIPANLYGNVEVRTVDGRLIPTALFEVETVRTVAGAQPGMFRVNVAQLLNVIDFPMSTFLRANAYGFMELTHDVMNNWNLFNAIHASATGGAPVVVTLGQGQGNIWGPGGPIGQLPGYRQVNVAVELRCSETGATIHPSAAIFRDWNGDQLGVMLHVDGTAFLNFSGGHVGRSISVSHDGFETATHYVTFQDLSIQHVVIELEPTTTTAPVPVITYWSRVGLPGFVPYPELTAGVESMAWVEIQTTNVPAGNVGIGVLDLPAGMTVQQNTFIDENGVGRVFVNIDDSFTTGYTGFRIYVAPGAPIHASMPIPVSLFVQPGFDPNFVIQVTPDEPFVVPGQRAYFNLHVPGFVGNIARPNHVGLLRDGASLLVDMPFADWAFGDDPWGWTAAEQNWTFDRWGNLHIGLDILPGASPGIHQVTAVLMGNNVPSTFEIVVANPTVGDTPGFYVMGADIQIQQGQTINVTVDGRGIQPGSFFVSPRTHLPQGINMLTNIMTTTEVSGGTGLFATRGTVQISADANAELGTHASLLVIDFGDNGYIVSNVFNVTVLPAIEAIEIVVPTPTYHEPNLIEYIIPVDLIDDLLWQVHGVQIAEVNINVVGTTLSSGSYLDESFVGSIIRPDREAPNWELQLWMNDTFLVDGDSITLQITGLRSGSLNHIPLTSNVFELRFEDYVPAPPAIAVPTPTYVAPSQARQFSIPIVVSCDELNGPPNSNDGFQLSSVNLGVVSTTLGSGSYLFALEGEIRRSSTQSTDWVLTVLINDGHLVEGDSITLVVTGIPGASHMNVTSNEFEVRFGRPAPIEGVLFVEDGGSVIAGQQISFNATLPAGQTGGGNVLFEVFTNPVSGTIEPAGGFNWVGSTGMGGNPSSGDFTLQTSAASIIGEYRATILVYLPEFGGYLKSNEFTFTVEPSMSASLYGFVEVRTVGGTLIPTASFGVEDVRTFAGAQPGMFRVNTLELFNAVNHQGYTYARVDARGFNGHEFNVRGMSNFFDAVYASANGGTPVVITLGQGQGNWWTPGGPTITLPGYNVENVAVELRSTTGEIILPENATFQFSHGSNYLGMIHNDGFVIFGLSGRHVGVSIDVSVDGFESASHQITFQDLRNRHIVIELEEAVPVYFDVNFMRWNALHMIYTTVAVREGQTVTPIATPFVMDGRIVTGWNFDFATLITEETNIQPIVREVGEIGGIANLQDINLGPAIVGYVPANYSATIVLENRQPTVAPMEFDIILSNPTEFTVNHNFLTPMPGSSATFVVTPVAGLATGTYTTTVAIVLMGIHVESFEVTFVVVDDVQHSVTVTAAGNATTVNRGDTLQFGATVQPTGGPVLWSVVGGVEGVSISNTGLLTVGRGVAQGTQITVRATSGSVYGERTVTVTPGGINLPQTQVSHNIVSPNPELGIMEGQLINVGVQISSVAPGMTITDIVVAIEKASFLNFDMMGTFPYFLFGGTIIGSSDTHIYVLVNDSATFSNPANIVFVLRATENRPANQINLPALISATGFLNF
ncbi:MAG: Ig-like domain-containing protein [Defluviitaleaceae bacterium]|nr:Ig-like domain-containing protein [Defluviitaleaceae bacterium]